jgi:hypothetical protein
MLGTKKKIRGILKMAKQYYHDENIE